MGYDARGRVNEEALFGPDGVTPYVDAKGVHRWVARLDERGKEVERSLFDGHDQPMRAR